MLLLTMIPSKHNNVRIQKQINVCLVDAYLLFGLVDTL